VSRRSWITTAIAIVVALGGVQHLIQATMGVRGTGDPRLLVLEHVDVTILSFIAVYAIVREKSWAPWAMVAAGIATAALVVSLGPLLNLDSASRSGLWSGATFILLLTAVTVWYLRRSLARASG
jgi:hypothetical protein